MTLSAGDESRQERSDRLTRRELEVLEFIVARYSNAEIAAKLTLSKRTVESHVSSLRRKLGARDRTALIQHGRTQLARRRVKAGSHSAKANPSRSFDGANAVLSAAQLEVAEARYRLTQLTLATRSARVRATRLRSRSAQRLLISLRKVESTRDTLERTQSAIAGPPDGRARPAGG